MSTSHIYTATCDVCGKTAGPFTDEDREAFPEGWVYLGRWDVDHEHACSLECAEAALIEQAKKKAAKLFEPVTA